MPFNDWSARVRIQPAEVAKELKAAFLAADGHVDHACAALGFGRPTFYKYLGLVGLTAEDLRFALIKQHQKEARNAAKDQSATMRVDGLLRRAGELLARKFVGRSEFTLAELLLTYDAEVAPVLDGGAEVALRFCEERGGDPDAEGLDEVTLTMLDENAATVATLGGAKNIRSTVCSNASAILRAQARGR